MSGPGNGWLKRRPVRSAMAALNWAPASSVASRMAPSATRGRAVRASAEKRPALDLEAEARRCHLLQLVGLVEDDQVMGGRRAPPGGQMGRVQVGVDDHHVRLRRPVPGGLGEADAAGRAPGRAGALGRAHAEHAPTPGRGARRTARPGHRSPVVLPQSMIRRSSRPKEPRAAPSCPGASPAPVRSS